MTYLDALLAHRFSWIEIDGYAASAAVFATFMMTTMIPLRMIALVSNVLFVSYGYFAEVYPLLILHSILFPVNLRRLIQFRRLIDEVRNAHNKELSIQSLLPYMKARTFLAGHTLVRKGEKAERLYYLAEGELEVTDFGKVVQAGAMIGEIGVFAADQERTSTVVCRSDCKLYELTEGVAKQLYFQDRAFGFAVMQLIINRLLENNRRLLQAKGLETLNAPQ